MVSEDVDANDSVVEVRVRRLENVVVGVLLVVECFEALEDKFEDGVEVFRRGSRHEDV